MIKGLRFNLGFKDPDLLAAWQYGLLRTSPDVTLSIVSQTNWLAGCLCLCNAGLSMLYNLRRSA